MIGCEDDNVSPVFGQDWDFEEDSCRRESVEQDGILSYELRLFGISHGNHEFQLMTPLYLDKNSIKRSDVV